MASQFNQAQNSTAICSSTFAMAPRKRKEVFAAPARVDSPALPTPTMVQDSAAATTSSAEVIEPPAKRARQVGDVGSVRSTTINHASHADQYACEQNVPLRTFQFDYSASGPAGQQASLERQGWNGSGRERVALHCPHDDCRAFIVVFVAASSTLAPTYQQRLCGHQFAANRACTAKWARHCGIGETQSGKQRAYRCAHQRGPAVHVPPAIAAPLIALSAVPLQTLNAAAALPVTGSVKNAVVEGTATTPNLVAVAASAIATVNMDTNEDANSRVDSENPPQLISEIDDEDEAVNGSASARLDDGPASTPAVRVMAKLDADRLPRPVDRVTLPAGMSLADLTTPPTELVIKDQGADAINKLASLMRPLLPRQMPELEPRELALDGGLACLQADIVQRMKENAGKHRQVPPDGCSGDSVSFEVQPQHRVYHVSREQVMCFVFQVERNSLWFKCTMEATKSLSQREGRQPGGRYNNDYRVESLVLAMVQLLFPHFAEHPLRDPNEAAQDSICNAYRSR